MSVGIDVGGRVIILADLEADLNAGSVATPNGLGLEGPSQPLQTPPAIPLPSNSPLPSGTFVFTYDTNGKPIDLPPEAGPIVAAYTPAQ